jgi:hypothetical protein
MEDDTTPASNDGYSYGEGYTGGGGSSTIPASNGGYSYGITVTVHLIMN